MGIALGLYKKMKNWMKMRKEATIKKVKRNKSKMFYDYTQNIKNILFS